jgi:hypothetical protein
METPIKITYRRLYDALAAGSYSRFVALTKTVSASHKNRAVPEAIAKEVQYFEASRDAIVKQYNGVVGATSCKWPDDKQAEADAAMSTLLDQEIALPGERIKFSDLAEVDNPRAGLREGDWKLLEAFLEA